MKIGSSKLFIHHSVEDNITYIKKGRLLKADSINAASIPGTILVSLPL
jgi:hypothetical protein